MSGLRRKAEAIRRSELARAERELTDAGAIDAAVLDRLSRRLLDQILAIPLAQLEAGDLPLDATHAEYSQASVRADRHRNRRKRTHMIRRLRIGTRGSALARWQSDFVAAELARIDPELCFEVVEISSTGDQITDQPLWQVEGTGFFTATIERALLDGDVDIAVHSYKDLPVDSTDGLVVAAVPPRGPVEDVLCARDGLTLATLPAGATIGTCSARRTAQVRAIRPDLRFHPLRGNVPTRLDRVRSGELDAIVLAKAGLIRLGLDAHISEVLSLDRVLPAPAQGALAIQCRIADTTIIRALASLDDEATRRRVDAERTVLHALGGGCSVPVGAIAVIDGDRLTLAAGVFSMEPCQSARAVAHGANAHTLGEQVARCLLKRGAGAILEAYDKVARLDVPLADGVVR